MHIPDRVRLFDLTTQNKLDTHLMFSSSFQPSSLFGVRFEFLLKIGAEIGLREVGTVYLMKVRA